MSYRLTKKSQWTLIFYPLLPLSLLWLFKLSLDFENSELRTQDRDRTNFSSPKVFPSKIVKREKITNERKKNPEKSEWKNNKFGFGLTWILYHTYKRTIASILQRKSYNKTKINSKQLPWGVLELVKVWIL